MRQIKTISLCVLLALPLSACNTADLVLDRKQTKTRFVDAILIEDQVIAFGRAAQSNNEFPQNSLIMAGQKQSYVITEGSELLQKMAERLNPQYVTQTYQFRFLSKDNDGHFTGSFPIEYVVPKHVKAEPNVQFLLQQGAEHKHDTETESRYLLHLNISGKVYPAVQNLKSLKSLSRPYKVEIYTQKTEDYKSREGYNFSTGQMILLTPFVLVFDIVTLPVKLFTQ